MLSPHVYPAVGQRGEIDNDCLYIHHPSRRLDLQSPLALQPISPSHSPDLINNSYLTGVHSTDSPTTSAFTVHLYIPEPTPDAINSIIAAQLGEMQKQGIHTSPDQLENQMTIEPIMETRDTTFLDDEPIASGTYLTPKHLEGAPHAHVITLPTFTPATYGLTLLASRQLRWTTTLPNSSIPAWIPESLRQPLLNQTPTITRANADRLTPAKSTCTIQSSVFQGASAIAAFRIFRAAAILTLYRNLSAVEHRQQNNSATSVDQLSQPTQALLQAMDSVQPACDWALDERPNTMIFYPTEIDYNTLRQQSQPYVLILQDPRAINNIIKFTIRPPRIRSYLRGDEAWYPWWRTALLVQSQDTLPLPTLDANRGEPTNYLAEALNQALQTSIAFLTSIQELQAAQSHPTTLLRAAPDGAFILSQAKKDNSSQNTNFIVSIADPVAYAMLATQSDPIKTTLSTATTTRGQTRKQITPINITAHTRSILGRTYGQLLTNPDITQLNPDKTPLQFNQAKGLTGRPSDKIAWATTVLAHPDILTAYEEGLQEPEDEEQQPNKAQPPPKGKPPTPTTKGKEKMTPMDRQIPDPLKLMRQQQAAEAKRLAAEQRQRSGKLKEQAKLRETEAAEKAANEERLKTPPIADPIGDPANAKDKLPDNPIGAAANTEDQQLDPITGLPVTQEAGDTMPPNDTGPVTEDPEILPDKVTTPEGEASDLSHDYTLTEEGEGENISGSKELRDDNPEEENSMKRAKGPQHTPETE
jgi:hypothetical protein